MHPEADNKLVSPTEAKKALREKVIGVLMDGSRS
jgi:hypothetical protein